MAARRWGQLATIASVLLALAPKCPLCLIGYAGLAGLASTAWWPAAYPMGIALTTGVSLALAVGALAWRADERGGYGPAALALVASLTLLIAKFCLDHRPSMLTALALLVAAVAWNSRRSRTKPDLNILPHMEVDRCHHSSDPLLRSPLSPR